MFLKLGDTYYAELNVVDSNGQKRDDDLPTMTIQDIDSKEYFNGVVWQTNQIALTLRCVGNGLYIGEFEPDRAGRVQVKLESVKYNCSKIDQIEIYEEINDSHQWSCGKAYTIEYTPSKDVEGDLYCTIAKEDSGFYFTGTTWKKCQTKLPLTPMNAGKYGYKFTPRDLGTYCISIVCGNTKYHYILEVVEDAKNLPPVIVTNASLLSLDGTDSTVIADNGVPIDKAEVTVYDPVSKEIVAKTSTNMAGEWQLMLEPGIWQFLFQKDGYISISFEREVS